jgi:hypothetical protein
MHPDARGKRPVTGEQARGTGWSGSLLLACGMAVAAAVVVLADVTNPALRLIVALPLVVVIPGYALMAATCPGPSVSGAERLALSIGTSLTMAVLGGLLLNWTPWGLQPSSWVILLSTLTLVAAAYAVVQRRRSPTEPASKPLRASATSGLGIGSGFLVGAAVLIVVGTVYLARLSAGSRAEEGFTQVWMLPAGESSPTSVRLGVNSREEAETMYVLRLDVDGAPLETWTSIVLAPGQTWETTAALPSDSSVPVVAEARLYRIDGPALSDEALSDPSVAYRRVMWYR